MEHRITVARGDGIGPEIMDATLRVLDAAGAPLAYDTIAVGEQVYREGHTAGIAPESWDVIRKNRVLLKAPITTPQGGGFKSLNVTIRKTLNLFANVRPSKSYAPFVASAHPGIDPRHRARERGGPLRRHRAPADAAKSPRSSSS